jgi:Tol biopolymer transport system component
MRLRRAAVALATLALVAVSGAGGAGSGRPANGPIVFAAGPDAYVGYMSQFVTDDLGPGRASFIEMDENAENPVLSPTGRFVTYHEWIGRYPESSRPEVFVQSTKNGSRHSIGRGCDPEWSPSGRQIAFIRVISDQFCNQAELAIVNRDGSGLRELVSGAVSRPTWSPDGRWIAFLQGADLRVIRPDGTDAHAVAFGVDSGTSWFPYSWAPDSRRLAVVEAGELKTVSVSTGGDTLADDAFWPRWSPGGRWIAFLRYRGSENEVVVVDVNDGRQTVVGQGLEPAWIGKDRLAFAANGGIRTVAHDGSSSRLAVRAPNFAWYRDLQPSGPRRGLAFRRETVDYAAQLFALDTDVDSVRRLTAPTVRGVDPAVSPDGRSVAFSRVRPEGNHVLAVVGVAGQRLRTLTHNRYGWDYEPAWSPNGKRIAFIRASAAFEGALYTVGARGGKPQRMWSGARPGHPSWAPDGRHIAIDGVYRSQTVGIRLVVPGTAGSVEITHPPYAYGQVDLAPSWSPDGAKLAFVRRSYQVHGYLDQAFVLTLATGEERPITTSGYENTSLHPLAARWSPDGTSVAVVTCVEPGFFTCVRAAVATVAPDGTGLVRHWERPKRSALDVAWAASPRR